MIESETTKAKSKHLGFYIGLCIVAWIIGAVVANGVSMMMASIYYEATLTVIIGFWAGKALLKNKSRGWDSIVAFPVINFISALFGFSLAHTLAPQYPAGPAFAVFIIAFILSCAIFFIINTKNNRHASA